METFTIYTIGHSNHSLERFVTLLRQNQIERVVDVRSVPYSRFSPHFRKKDLESSLSDAGIDYAWAGDRLGGRPESREFYDAAGNLDYARIAASSWYVTGIADLVSTSKERKTAVMCSEEDPGHCHRNLLISQSLLSYGDVEVLHIRGDGRTEPAEIVPRQSRLL